MSSQRHLAPVASVPLAARDHGPRVLGTAAGTGASVSELLVAEVGRCFADHQQLLATAVHYQALALPGLGRFFHQEAAEAYGTATRILRYVARTTDVAAVLPPVAAPDPLPSAAVEGPSGASVRRERQASARLQKIGVVARATQDFAAEFFVMGLIGEQQERIARHVEVDAILRRSGRDLDAVERAGFPGRDRSTRPRRPDERGPSRLRSSNAPRRAGCPRP